MNKINELYAAWASDKTDQKLSDLLQLVTVRVRQRYCEIDTNFEDLAQETVLEVWRAMVGDIVKYSPERGTFAGFCAMKARRVRHNMLRSEHLTATKDEGLDEAMSEYADDEKGY